MHQPQRVNLNTSCAVVDELEKNSEPRRTPLSRYKITFVIFAIILVLPALYRPTLYGKLRFDSHTLGELNAIRPEYVFIGNSMLGTRIDETTLESRLGKNCCYLLWTGGAESAWEHQALKNWVLAADHRPKVVFIFFRDTYLTRVTYRTDDSYWWKIEQLSVDREPELTSAMRKSRTWREKAEYELGLIYPLQKRRDAANYGFDWLANQVISPGTTAFGAPVGERFNALFSLDKLRSVEAADDANANQEDKSLYDFRTIVDRSLLPSMLRLARRAGVKLVFVRVQRRPSASAPPAQSQSLRRYMGELQAYLAANDADFYDFNGDPELTLNRYMDGDHIRGDWRSQSTDLFLRRLKLN